MRQQVMRTTKRLRFGRVALIACALAGAWLQLPAAQGVAGQWTQVTATVPINPVHMALMNNGKVLIVAGSGNVATNTNFRAIVWDPQIRIRSNRSKYLLEPHYARLGHVLQRHGRAARRSDFHQRREPGLRPVLGRAPDSALRSRRRRLYEYREHGPREVVPDGHGARRRQHHDIFRAAGSRWHELDCRDLHARLGLEPAVLGWLDTATLSPYAPADRRQGGLRRLGVGNQDVQPGDACLVGGDHQHAQHTYTHVWHVGAAAVVSRRWLQIPRHDFWRRQPLTRFDRDHRLLRSDTSMAGGPANVAAAHRDERDHPAERESTRHRRIAQR